MVHVDREIDRHIVNASKAFGALGQTVFKDHHFTINTKGLFIKHGIVSALMWRRKLGLLRRHLNKLNSFHHHCIRTVLGITNRQQWEQHISSEQLQEKCGNTKTITTKLQKRRLEWLRHLARMPDHCMPKITLFSWMPQPHPCCRPRRRWRDVLKKDAWAMKIVTDAWYSMAQDRNQWYMYVTYSKGTRNHQEQQQKEKRQEAGKIECTICKRFLLGERLTRQGTNERVKPAHEQTGSVRCTTCQCWFKSRGGFAVCRCSTTTTCTNTPQEDAIHKSRSTTKDHSNPPTTMHLSQWSVEYVAGSLEDQEA